MKQPVVMMTMSEEGTCPASRLSAPAAPDLQTVPLLASAVQDGSKKRGHRKATRIVARLTESVINAFSTERMDKRESLLSSLVVQSQPDVVPNRYVRTSATVVCGGGAENPVFDHDEPLKLRVDLPEEVPAEKKPKNDDGSDLRRHVPSRHHHRRHHQASHRHPPRGGAADECLARRRQRVVFPRVEIAISDVVDERGLPIERHFDIADSAFYQPSLLGAEANACTPDHYVTRSSTGATCKADILWCGRREAGAGAGVAKPELDHERLMARMEMPRDAYNKLVSLAAVKYLLRPTEEDSHYETFPNEAFGGNKLLLPSIGDAVRFCMYARAFEELGQCLWYWGSCGVDRAVHLLRDTKVGSFMVRNSRQPYCPIAMTLHTEKGINSVRIEFDAVNADRFPSRPCCLHHGAEQSRLFSIVRTALGYSDIIGAPDLPRPEPETSGPAGEASGYSHKVKSAISHPIKIYHRATMRHLCRLALNQRHGTWRDPHAIGGKLVADGKIDAEQLGYLLKYPYPV